MAAFLHLRHPMALEHDRVTLKHIRHWRGSLHIPVV